MAERIRSAFRRWTGVMAGIGLLAGLAGSQVFGPDQGFGPSSWIGWGIGAWVIIGWLAECLRGTGHVSTYALFQPGWWMLLAGLLIAFGVDDPVVALVMSAVGMPWWPWWPRLVVPPSIPDRPPVRTGAGGGDEPSGLAHLAWQCASPRSVLADTAMCPLG